MFPRKQITKSDLDYIAEKLNVTLGEQLIGYLTNYGLLDEDEGELFGYWQGEILNASIIKTNLSERGIYGNLLDGYIVIENDGFGNLTLIDSDDNVYLFNHNNNSIKNLNEKFNEYYKKIFGEKFNP